jgi:hypothetical protein
LFITFNDYTSDGLIYTFWKFIHFVRVIIKELSKLSSSYF